MAGLDWFVHSRNISTRVGIYARRKTGTRRPSFAYKVNGLIFDEFRDAVLDTESHANAKGELICIERKWIKAGSHLLTLYNPKGIAIGAYHSFSELSSKIDAATKLFPPLSDADIERNKERYYQSLAKRKAARVKVTPEKRRAMIEKEKEKLLKKIAYDKNKVLEEERIRKIEARNERIFGSEMGSW